MNAIIGIFQIMSLKLPSEAARIVYFAPYGVQACTEIRKLTEPYRTNGSFNGEISNHCSLILLF